MKDLRFKNLRFRHTTHGIYPSIVEGTLENGHFSGTAVMGGVPHVSAAPDSETSSCTEARLVKSMKCQTDFWLALNQESLTWALENSLWECIIVSHKIIIHHSKHEKN